MTRLKKCITYDIIRIISDWSFFQVIVIFLLFGCDSKISKDEKLENGGYHFELVDSINIEIPYDFGFVNRSSDNGYFLAFTYLDYKFHLIDTSGKVHQSFLRRGEGPKEYSETLPFATIYKEQMVFMDDNNLYFYSFNGNWIKSLPYNDPEVTSYGGIPIAGLFFLDDNTFVVSNQHLGDLIRRPDHLNLLDTAALWIKYQFSTDSKQFEKIEYGLLDTTSVLYSDLKYSNYKPEIWINDNNVFQFIPISSILYKYQKGKSKYPDKKIELKIPGFKIPIGLDHESMSVENYKTFNRASSINSNINYVVSIKEDGSPFLIYSTGINMEFEQNVLSENEVPDAEFFGLFHDLSTSKSYQVKLPQNQENPSFYKKILYLGDSKFLFVFENETERDFYIGKIYKLNYFNNN